METAEKYRFIHTSILEALQIPKRKKKRSTQKTQLSHMNEQAVLPKERAQIIKEKLIKIFNRKISNPPWWNSETYEIRKLRYKMEKDFLRNHNVQSLNELDEC